MQEKLTPALNAQQCQSLLVLANTRARALGLAGEEPDDCALAFIGHLLRQIELHPQATLPRLQSAPWLFRCADNWAKNYARQHRRRSAYEQPWPEETFEANDAPLKEFSSEELGPEQKLLGQELTCRMEVALQQLTPVQRDLFRRHCIEGETLIHIAQTTGRTPEAARQAFCLLRKRLQHLLTQTGLSQHEAMDYLYQMLTVHR